jgi:hypothetical protein
MHKYFYLSLLLLLLMACGKDPATEEFSASNPLNPPQASEDPPQKEPTPPAPPATPTPPNKPRNYAAAPWAHVEGTVRWTDTVLDLIGRLLPKLEMAQDKEIFCPGYKKANATQREHCWLRVVGAVTKFESSFQPHDAFKEPDGNWSVGLLALSPGECPNAPTLESLKNPTKNLACGFAKMANLIARDGWIDGPVGKRGAAAYWSVLRKPYTYQGYKLGKKDLILPITAKYRIYN